MRSVILHLDMDCYYAQCESKRLGLPSDVPLAVSQWGGLLAVNYAARSFGVRRGDRVEAAIQKIKQSGRVFRVWAIIEGQGHQGVVGVDTSDRAKQLIFQPRDDARQYSSLLHLQINQQLRTTPGLFYRRIIGDL